MKKGILLGILGLIIIVTVLYAQERRTEGQQGRFQLVQATYSTSFLDKNGMATPLERTNLFRIDTETGDVWQFFAYGEVGKYTEYWVKVLDREEWLEREKLINEAQKSQ